MTSRTAVAVAVVAGGLAGFLAGRWSSSAPAPSDESPRHARDDGVAAALDRLSSRIDRIEEALPAPTRRAEAAAAEAHAPPAAGESGPGRPPEPPADPYATWSDEEIALVALSKGDDLGLFKAALRRTLPAGRRAKLLLALAAYRHKLEWHGAAEREALIEAVALAPTTTAVGAEAAVALAYNYAAAPDEGWRCRSYFEAVLRGASGEEQRMKGAYGLAWLHDLGDEPKEAAVAAYREFLAQWGDKWAHTVEVQWAKQRIALHERGD